MQEWGNGMAYTFIPVKSEISVDALVTVHYFEYANDYAFAGERHNFWEIVYVDSGEVEITSDSTVKIYKKGDIIFHKPLEFHALRAVGTTAPNLIVVSFDCRSEAMKFFSGKCYEASAFESGLLASVIREARNAFSTPLNDPMTTEMVVNSSEFGSLQLIKLYLEQFLIDLYREHINDSENSSPASKITTFIRENSDAEQLQNIVNYFKENICRHLTIDEICKDNYVSYSKIKQLFRDNTNCGVLEYYNQMRINYAKQLIRNENMNISEIAETMGYNSIHYFSRQFKQISGMSPTEYSSSCMLRSEVDYKQQQVVWMTA